MENFRVKYASKKNIHTSETRRLRYCKDCEYVWERGERGHPIKYTNLPTYCLPRVVCKMCKSIKKQNLKTNYRLTRLLYPTEKTNIYLSNEKIRLEKKGWELVVASDEKNQISLWRIK